MYPQLSGAVVVLTMTLFPGPLGPATPWQGSAVGYTAAQLDCARFLETGESKILTEAGGRTRHQTSARRGVWQFRAAPSDGGVASGGLARFPGPDPAVAGDSDQPGHRWPARRTLPRDAQSNRVLHQQRSPFVPDEVAEMAGMSRGPG